MPVTKPREIAKHQVAKSGRDRLTRMKPLHARRPDMVDQLKQQHLHLVKMRQSDVNLAHQSHSEHMQAYNAALDSYRKRGCKEVRELSKVANERKKETVTGLSELAREHKALPRHKEAVPLGGSVLFEKSDAAATCVVEMRCRPRLHHVPEASHADE